MVNYLAYCLTLLDSPTTVIARSCILIIRNISGIKIHLMISIKSFRYQ